MASLRRNKTLSPDGQTARFLYTIIKQLDLKAIDWNLVAGSLEITNGHAARMRYSRFKQHMEGATTQPRTPRAGKKEKEGKEGKEGAMKGKKRGFKEDVEDKKEAASSLKEENAQDGEPVRVKREGGGKRIKGEPDASMAPCAVHIKSEHGLLQDEKAAVVEVPPAIKVKREPELDQLDFTDPDIWHILPRTTTGTENSLQDRTPRSTTFTAPALTTQPPPLRQLQNVPPHSTVSLAQLEVTPRSRASAVPAADAGVSRSRFLGGIDSVQVKAEPGLDMDWTVSQPSAGVVVKSEPVEM